MTEYIVDLAAHNASAAMALCDGVHQEIVRCRDCKHYDERDAGCSYFVLAKNKLLHIGNPDGFCKWGERKCQ